jgi:hypothetical protein
LQILWRKLLLYDFRLPAPVVFYTTPLRKPRSTKATNHLLERNKESENIEIPRKRCKVCYENSQKKVLSSSFLSTPEAIDFIWNQGLKVSAMKSIISL